MDRESIVAELIAHIEKANIPISYQYDDEPDCWTYSCEIAGISFNYIEDDFHVWDKVRSHILVDTITTSFFGLTSKTTTEELHLETNALKELGAIYQRRVHMTDKEKSEKQEEQDILDEAKAYEFLANFVKNIKKE